MHDTTVRSSRRQHVLPGGSSANAAVLASALIALIATGCGLGESAQTAATGAAASSAEMEQKQTLPEEYERKIEEAEQLYQRRLEEAERGSQK